MDMVKEILDWASGLPMWQRDAVRRIVSQEALSENDRQEVLLLLKNEHGIPIPEALVPTPLPATRSDFPSPTKAAAGLLLRRLSKLENVNAITPEHGVDFAPTGMTVVYGGNASGKSGYARVLKRACRARDEREPILPNVYEVATGSGPARASFTLEDLGSLRDIEWIDGKPAPEELGSISVFDAKCARLYVNEANEVVYLPYGLDVFQKLAELCKDLDTRLAAEAASLSAAHEALTLLDEDSAAGLLVRGLSHSSDRETLRQQAAFSKADENRLEKLRKEVARCKAEDPRKRATAIRQIRARIDRLRTRVESIDKKLSDAAVAKIRDCQRKTNALEQAARLASDKRFRKEPLPGVGSEAWREMFEAARAYSEKHAYPGKAFPLVEEGGRCVLCQQPLKKEAQTRLTSFNSFVTEQVQKKAELQSKAFSAIFADIRETDTKPQDMEPEVLQEVRERNTNLYELVIKYVGSLERRRAAIQNAMTTGNWSDIPALQETPAKMLGKMLIGLEEEAKKVEATANPKETAKLERDLRELKAQELLRDHLGVVLTYLKQLKVKFALEKCRTATKTTGITRKGGEMTDRILTKSLKEALEEELKELGVGNVGFELKRTGTVGSMYHQLLLAGIASPVAGISSVLSEGEQQAVAIASFLAELRTSPTAGGIIFDDPVCSLDHKWRERVARRLVKEGAKRQVVVFTHDVRFFLDLEGEATEQRVSFLAQHLTRSKSRAGMIDPDLPWEVRKTKERVYHLHGLIRKAEKEQAANGDSKAYIAMVSKMYGLLRRGWEGAVEDVVFNEVVRRFRSSVQTQRLKKVVFEDPDYEKVYRGMRRSSKMIDAHDPGRTPPASPASPADMRKDVEALSDFVSDLRKRQDTAEKPRRAYEKPPTATI